MSEDHTHSEHSPQNGRAEHKIGSASSERPAVSHDESTPEQTAKPIVEHVVAEAKKIAKNLENTSPSKRFFVMFVGMFGFLLVLISIWFALYALFSSSSRMKDDIDLAMAFPKLDATLSADHPEINAELRIIVDENASPAQLMNKEIPTDRDLADLFNKELRVISWAQLLPEMRLYISRTPWRVGVLEIKNILSLLEQNEEKRKKIRDMLDLADVDMQPTYTIDQFGLTLNQKNRDFLWAYVHLEEYEIARALTGLSLQQIKEAGQEPKEQRANMSQAVDALCYIFKVAEIASRQKDLNLRMDAAYIRENAFDTLQTLVARPEFSLHEATVVLNVLENQLAVWPTDGLAFEGERTAGIWIYELARRRKLIDSMAREDVAALQKLGTLIAVEQAILRNVDMDELFYLKRMGHLIFLCQEPYYNRLERLNHWEDELESLRGDLETYPTLAGAVLLRDTRTTMYRLAIDRARAEAWTLALASSLGQPTGLVGVHPMTGQPYRVRVMATPLASQKSTISLQWLESEKPIEIPGYSYISHE